MWQSISGVFRLPSDNPVLMQAQLRALTRQLPAMYVLLTINSVALGITHFPFAPWGLTVAAPGVLVAVCLARIWIWARSRPDAWSEERTYQRLRSTILMSALLGPAFALWSLGLAAYGDSHTKAHVAFFMSITVVGCIFSLMHLRPAALIVAGCVIVPFTAFFLSSGQPVFVAIALNFVLVTLVLVRILLTYYGDFTALVDSKTALTAQHATAEELGRANFRLASVDSLTGLPNRRQFFSRIQALLDGPATPFVVGVIDLDGFKPVNDLHGHVAGDRLLIEVGSRLQALCNDSTFIARMGGDEFSVIIEGAVTRDAIAAYGERIIEALARPFWDDYEQIKIAGSIGFVSYPESGRTAEQLYERADYALYHAKSTRPGTAVLFSYEHETAIRRRSEIDQHLRHCDLERELSVEFQPIVDAHTRRPFACEALARWDNPHLGRVPPSEFIPLAEQSGLITNVTEVLLEKALAVAASWPSDMVLSFNLSMRDIGSRDAVSRIETVILKSGFDPARIVLEITETAIMRDFAQARDALLRLRAIGVSIALDDFGTGYSSLSYVHKLPLDKVKVDRSFIAEIETDGRSRDLVKSIVDLCRNLRLDCVVEGVETVEQMLILRAIGCTRMQGYFFHRPMPAETLAGLLAEGAAPAAAWSDGRAIA
jgi:diguanylate cyclase (GGDEF)-like protein